MKKKIKEHIGTIVSIASILIGITGFYYIKYTGGTIETVRIFILSVMAVASTIILLTGRKGDKHYE